MTNWATSSHATRPTTPLLTVASGPGFVLAVVDSRSLLFSEAAQAVYELDEFSAYIWRSLNSGFSTEQIVGEIVDAGGEPEAAHRAIVAAVQQLLVIEGATARKTVPAKTIDAERLTPITLALAGVAMQLKLSELLLAEMDATFGYLRSEATGSHIQVSACAAGDLVEVQVAGGPASSCRRSQFVPLVKTLLIDSVLKCAGYEVALHAAALTHQGTSLLLVGSPGAGKTTLAAALVRRGFKIACDDVALLDNTGLLTGLLLPFTVKEGAWSILSGDWPELPSQPVYQRQDGIRVRYLQCLEFANRRRQRIEVVILLDRQSGGPASLQGIGAVAALQALIAEGDARDERLSETGFRSLVAALRDARCFRLTYCELAGAAEAVTSICS